MRSTLLFAFLITVSACGHAPPPGDKKQAEVTAGQARVAPEAAPPDTTFEEDILALLEATNALQTARQICAPIIVALAEAHPGVPMEIWRELVDSMDDSEFVNLMVEVHKRHYTREEVRALLAFYQSEVGKRVVAKMPAIIADSQRVGVEWGQRIAEKFIEEVRKRGYEL